MTFRFFSWLVCLAANPLLSFAESPQSQEIEFEEYLEFADTEIESSDVSTEAQSVQSQQEATAPLNQAMTVESKAAEAPQDQNVSAQIDSSDASAQPQATANAFSSKEKKGGKKKCCPKGKPEKRWYIEVKPGYYYFTDKSMRDFFDNGGWTVRAETGYRFWKPLTVWLDAGYFQKKGHALGGSQDLRLKLASMTLGLKGLFYWGNSFAFYASAGPRLFMMLLHNDSTFVRSEDNQVSLGGGFNLGFWVFPVPWVPDLFLDLFVDYSWKNMGIDKDENSSFNFDVNVSGLTGGLGLGYRF